MLFWLGHSKLSFESLEHVMLILECRKTATDEGDHDHMQNHPELASHKGRYRVAGLAHGLVLEK